MNRYTRLCSTWSSFWAEEQKSPATAVLALSGAGELGTQAIDQPQSLDQSHPPERETPPLQAATPPRARRSPLPHRGDQSRAWGSRALWRCEWRGSTSRPGSRSPAAQPDPQDRTQRLGSYTDLTLSSAALLVVHAEPVVCISTPAHSPGDPLMVISLDALPSGLHQLSAHHTAAAARAM